MNREAKQEIRRVLLGRTEPAKDGRLTAMEKGQVRIPIGVADGAVAVRFFGICKKARRLKASCSEEKAKQIALSLMQDIGRVLYLPHQPDVSACLIRYLLSRPVVLIFDFQDGIPVLTAWTGRGLSGWLSLRRALRSFIKRMPKELTVSDQPIPKDRDTELEKQKKAEKKQKKKNKKKDKSSNQKEPVNNAEDVVSEETTKYKEEQPNESES